MLYEVITRWFSFVLYGSEDENRSRVPPRWQANTVFLVAVLALLIYLLVDFWHATTG